MQGEVLPGKYPANPAALEAHNRCFTDGITTSTLSGFLLQGNELLVPVLVFISGKLAQICRNCLKSDNHFRYLLLKLSYGISRSIVHRISCKEY